MNGRILSSKLAGGIGITPFRRMIKDAVERCLPHTLALVYSNRNPASAAFLGDLEAWAKQAPVFRLIPTVTEPEPHVPWRHESGPVDASFITRHVGPVGDSICHVAGPAPLVRAMMALLPAAGADPDSLRAEEFAGY